MWSKVVRLLMLGIFATTSAKVSLNLWNEEHNVEQISARSNDARYRRAPPASPHTHPPDYPQVSLQHGQCDVGTNSFCVTFPQSTIQYSESNRLYVVFGLPARCSGMIIKWEFCCVVSSAGQGIEPSQESTVSMVILRRDDESQQKYRVINIESIELQEQMKKIRSNEGDTIRCFSIDSQDDVDMQEGDMVGFVSGAGARILMTNTFQHDVGMLRAYNFSTQQEVNTSIASCLSTLGSIHEDQFESINQSVSPILRAIINQTLLERNATTSESSSTVPCTTDCEGEGLLNITDIDILTNTIFLSVVVVASSVIFLLLLLVLILSCCLCHVKCRHCKLCYRCGNCFSCCRGNDQVVHRIKVEPLSSALDQSMEYNELYVPSSHVQTLRIEQGSLHKNPAYSSTSTFKSVDEVDGKVDKAAFEESSAIEHTYEMIDTLH